MRRPVVGVIGNAHRIENRFAVQMVGERNLRAVADVAGALPLMFAAAPEITDIGALLDVVDGVVLTGARANVHPTVSAPNLTRSTSLTISRAMTSRVADRSLCRPRRAAVRHLPGLAGDERRFRRFAASRNP